MSVPLSCQLTLRLGLSPASSLVSDPRRCWKQNRTDVSQSAAASSPTNTSGGSVSAVITEKQLLFDKPTQECNTTRHVGGSRDQPSLRSLTDLQAASRLHRHPKTFLQVKYTPGLLHTRWEKYKDTLQYSCYAPLFLGSWWNVCIQPTVTDLQVCGFIWTLINFVSVASRGEKKPKEWRWNGVSPSSGSAPSCVACVGWIWTSPCGSSCSSETPLDPDVPSHQEAWSDDCSGTDTEKQVNGLHHSLRSTF